MVKPLGTKYFEHFVRGKTEQQHQAAEDTD
jgi:hypothetical protein